MLEQRAASFTKRSIKADAKSRGLRLALSMIDLTTLEGKDSPEKVRSLCRKAILPHPQLDGMDIPPVAAVCVYPALVGIARDMLEGTPVRVASVATAFPSGQYPLSLRLEDVRQAIADGADEIDMVINRGAFLAGHRDLVAEEITAVKRACGEKKAAEPAHLKIILETSELETYDAIRAASDLAIKAAAAAVGSRELQDGEVFIKTSTGKARQGATMPVTLVMLEAIREYHRATGIRIGIKPAGGISTAKQALHYLVMVKETLGDAWLTPDLFRFGASSLANDLIRQITRGSTGTYMAPYDYSET